MTEEVADGSSTGESRLKRLLRVDIFVKYLPSGTPCVSVGTFIRLNWLIGWGWWRITQMTVNSVWSKPELGTYSCTSDQPRDYGNIHEMAKSNKKEDGSKYEDDSGLLNEYKPGLRTYIRSNSAGSYKMNVSDRHVTIDF